MVKEGDSDVKVPRQEEVWAAGENKAVGLAVFVSVCAMFSGLASGVGWGVSFANAGLVFFSLWFVVALLQIVTRALMVSVTAGIMAWQDAPKRAMSDEEIAAEIEGLRTDLTEILPARMKKAAKHGAGKGRRA